MPQFTPADRETVREHIEAQAFVNNTATHGPGLLVVKESANSDEGTANSFTDLMDTYGWYVASFTFKHNGSRQVLMPVTEAAHEA